MRKSAAQLEQRCGSWSRLHLPQRLAQTQDRVPVSGTRRHGVLRKWRRRYLRSIAFGKAPTRLERTVTAGVPNHVRPQAPPCRRGLWKRPICRKMAVSAGRWVSQVRRQISSALIVLNRSQRVKCRSSCLCRPSIPSDPRRVGTLLPAGHDMISPPSMLIVWPVMYAASSDARNATSAATSAGVPARPMGIPSTHSAINSPGP
jgi:hypothetical protein